jgi:NhaP-type Na+/H+ or K+/H+ antiporter
MSAVRQDGRGQAFDAMKLALAGGLAFWASNFAISRTSIAAEYRAALSISYLPMLIESLVGGLIIGFCVGLALLRFFDRIPTKNSILKSVILSLIALVFFTAFFEVPPTFFTMTSDAMRYFLIGTMFNVVRILALGLVIGYLHSRIVRRPDSRIVRRPLFRQLVYAVEPSSGFARRS